MFDYLYFHHQRPKLLAALLLVLIMAGTGSPAIAVKPEQPSDLWAALKTGTAFAIMRHALAPGTGDPANFNVADCSTQRNLSGDGRRQAIEIGNRFRESGIANAEVYTSACCRCRETAELLQLGKVRHLGAISSFFREPEQAEAQTNALKSWLSGYRSNAALILVTHYVNIAALTGVYPRSGEIVVVQRLSGGRLKVMGSL